MPAEGLRQVDRQPAGPAVVRLTAVRPVGVRPAGAARDPGSDRLADPAQMVDHHSCGQSGSTGGRRHPGGGVDERIRETFFGWSIQEFAGLYVGLPTVHMAPSEPGSGTSGATEERSPDLVAAARLAA